MNIIIIIEREILVYFTGVAFAITFSTFFMVIKLLIKLVNLLSLFQKKKKLKNKKKYTKNFVLGPINYLPYLYFFIFPLLKFTFFMTE